ncbi:MAG: hypothetical protein ABI266_06345 [Ginsengibacter sp.]
MIVNVEFALLYLIHKTNTKLKETVYKAGLRSDIYYSIGFLIFILFAVPLSSKFSNSSWPYLVIFLLLFILFYVIIFRLNEIKLDEINNSLNLIQKNFIGIKKTLKYDLREIEFTYKRQSTSFRSGAKNVCTIYFSDKKINQLVPGNDDWSDGEIRRFVAGLIDSNVKKKFIGFTLKDVEI